MSVLRTGYADNAETIGSNSGFLSYLYYPGNLHVNRMDFEIIPAHELSFADQAEVFTDAFAGYLAGSKPMDADALAALLSSQGIDLFHSRFVRKQKDRPVAFGYITRTGNISRLSGMGTVSAARRTGAAGSLLSHLLEQAQMRGDQAMMLEVFEQNEPALALYRQHGFRELTRLFGWRGAGNPAAAGTHELREIAILDALRLPNAVEYPQLPWQISRHAVAKLPLGRAFGANGAAVVIGDPESNPIRLHAFLGLDRDWTALRKIMASLPAKFPNKEFFAPAIFPEHFGKEIFEPLGFHREPLNQFLMRRDL